MNKSINKLNKSLKTMTEYIEAFNFLLPRGEYAKEEAIQEWEACINDVIVQINNIKNRQIELIENN